MTKTDGQYANQQLANQQLNGQKHTKQNTINSQGLYIWQADNLLTATKAMNGKWLTADDTMPSFASGRISTDTRTLQTGDVFLALSGNNFDGHDYINRAVSLGAVAVIVERPSSITVPQLVVEDTRITLGLLAAHRRMAHRGVTIIAITGSSGKTTCKEMLGSIFSRLAPTLITRGNLNNDLGVPMMLLELSDQHQYAILELGANHIGEIAYTSNIVRPDVACVLNVGTAHLGEFGSRQGICQTKAEIYHTLSDKQHAIVPDKDDFSHELRKVAEQHTSHVIGFGNTDISASHLEVEPERSEFMLHFGHFTHHVKLPLSGEHNVNNALAAAACAYAVGIDIADIIIGLEQTRPPKGRLSSQLLGKHRLIDDTYNANPHSVRVAAKVLASQTGDKILVLGDMGELGKAAVAEHQALGRTIATVGIDALFAVGEFAPYTIKGANEVGGIEAVAFDNKTDLLTALQARINQEQTSKATLLFKGSRHMCMETLIEALAKESEA